MLHMLSGNTVSCFNHVGKALNNGALHGFNLFGSFLYVVLQTCCIIVAVRDIDNLVGPAVLHALLQNGLSFNQKYFIFIKKLLIQIHISIQTFYHSLVILSF